MSEDMNASPVQHDPLFEVEESEWQRRNLRPARRTAALRKREPLMLSDAPKPEAAPQPVAPSPPKPAAKSTAAASAPGAKPAAKQAAKPAAQKTQAAKAGTGVKKPTAGAKKTTAATGGKPAAKTGAPKAGAAKTASGGKGKKTVAKKKKPAAGGVLGQLQALAKRLPHKRKSDKPVRELPQAASIALTVFLSLAICALSGLFLHQRQEHKRFEQMRSVVERKSFYEGTQVDGVDVSGMSLRKAQEYWTNTIEPTYADRTVTIANVEGRSITAKDLGYSSDYMDVLAAAWDAGRSGSLVDRYNDITERTAAPASYSVTRKLYDDTLISHYVQAAARTMNRDATEPTVASFSMDGYVFSFNEGTSGQKLDEERMAADIRAALENGGGTVTMVLNEVRPEHTVADIKDDYGMIASARTNASSSSSARLSNLRVALASINGVSIKPGETFSFNQTVGQRTTARGYLPAGAYAAGEVIEEVGGGICQVSTTLFNAVVKANLEINERHNHSMPVGYVDKGKDATVDWGRLDFKFTNNTDTEIHIAAYLNSEKRVIVGIFGKKLPDGVYITVEGVTTGTEDFQTVYEVDATLAPGTEMVKQEGRTGYTAEAYKIVWDKDGKQLSRSLLCKSQYLARDKIIAVPKQ